MTRLTLLRSGWVAGLGIVVAILVLVVPFRQFGLLLSLLVALVLLAPGRVQGYLYRDFFRGRRLVDQKRYRDAVPYLERFLLKIRSAPWLKHAIWLSWPGYSTDIEAMTLTNLGAATMEMGDLKTAEELLRRATAVDSRTPLPWVNLGMIYATQGDSGRATEAMAMARRLGYRGDALDTIQRHLASMLAAVEGSRAGASPQAEA